MVRMLFQKPITQAELQQIIDENNDVVLQLIGLRKRIVAGATVEAGPLYCELEPRWWREIFDTESDDCWLGPGDRTGDCGVEIKPANVRERRRIDRANAETIKQYRAWQNAE